MDAYQKAVALLKALLTKDKPWWGKVEFSIEAGKLVNVKVTENVKL